MEDFHMHVVTQIQGRIEEIQVDQKPRHIWTPPLKQVLHFVNVANLMTG